MSDHYSWFATLSSNVRWSHFCVLFMVFCFEIGQPDLRSQVHVDVLDYEILLSTSPVLSLYLFPLWLLRREYIQKISHETKPSWISMKTKMIYHTPMRSKWGCVVCLSRFCFSLSTWTGWSAAEPLLNLCRTSAATSTAPPLGLLSGNREWSPARSPSRHH